VAHELRNPLAGISGALQVIGSSLADDDRRRPVMDKVGQQVRRLNALVTDLLTFARPEAAKMRPLDLGEVVRAAVDATERGEVTVDVLGGGRALGDVHLLQHMVVNLVQNAVQAVGQGGHVRVVLGPASVLVCDDGPGVPDANRASIFEPFYTTRTQGTGLGLAICRKAATAMGASIDLATSPLGGAAFEIRLQPDPANPVV
jgi:signal transduction histidine kinase